MTVLGVAIGCMLIITLIILVGIIVGTRDRARIIDARDRELAVERKSVQDLVDERARDTRALHNARAMVDAGRIVHDAAVKLLADQATVNVGGQEVVVGERCCIDELDTAVREWNRQVSERGDDAVSRMAGSRYIDLKRAHEERMIARAFGEEQR